MTLRPVLLAALVLAVLAPSTFAQDLTATDRAADEAPARFTYTGLLTDAGGDAIADGTRHLVFRAYASPEAARLGEAPVWEEAHAAAVVGGRFLTVLGSKSALSDDARYITIAVDGEAASAPVRLGREASAEGGFAPGNTLQDSYDNGRFINVADGAPIQFTGALGQIGFITRDVTPVFISDQLMRFRMRSVQGGRTWEYRVYGDNNPDEPAGVFSIADATGGGVDAFQIHPGVLEDVLVLRQNTAFVGAIESPRQLIVVTTPTSSTQAGFFAAYDENDNGAASVWTDENGFSHTIIQPDSDGEGGDFYVKGASGSAFDVDGAGFFGGPRITIGHGLSSAIFDGGLSGSEQVQLPVDAIEASEVLDEAGVAYNRSNAGIAITPGATNITLSRSITVPTSGYVLAMATAEVISNHSEGTASIYRVSVSQDCDASPTHPVAMSAEWRLPKELPSSTYSDITSVQGVFGIGFPGTITFCTLVTSLGASAGSVTDQQLSLLFVPTWYGTVSSNLGDPAEDAEQLADQAALTLADVAAERAASIQENDARLAQELARIQARLDEIMRDVRGDR